jgi:hypothetical protein
MAERRQTDESHTCRVDFEFDDHRLLLTAKAGFNFLLYLEWRNGCA